MSLASVLANERQWHVECPPEEATRRIALVLAYINLHNNSACHPCVHLGEIRRMLTEEAKCN